MKIEKRVELFRNPGSSLDNFYLLIEGERSLHESIAGSSLVEYAPMYT